MTVEFRVLGPLEVVVDGEPVHLGGRKPRALLAMLLLHANEVVSSERLVDEIWRGSTVEAGTRSLHVYVSNLRKVLGPSGRLQTGPGGYTLLVEPHQVDAERCELLVRSGRLAKQDGDEERAADLFREALALWRGPPLVDLTYESFAQVEVARLEELRLAVLHERIEVDLALGRHEVLTAELEKLVQQHPLRDGFRTDLMLALYRSGRQSDALACYEEARRRLRDEMGLDPSPELRELQAAILRQDPGLSVEPPELRARRHLPAAATSLVGRREDVEAVRSLLQHEGARLVTLTGPGGVGKTRLGLQAAHDLAEQFPDGVYFVGLASVADSSLVAPTIATAIGTRQGARRSLLESLHHDVADRRLLLLVDNFEHVDPAAPVLSDLLSAAPSLQIIVTSRSRLGLYGEHEYPVQPLQLPELQRLGRLEEVAQLDAVALFVARAQAVKHDFRLTHGNAPVVAELCVRLDGLPLAIELAAARSREWSPERMVAEVPLALTERGPRDVAPRHQTLRATIQWSHGLLTPAEQQVFRRLAAFAGGSTLAAANAVCDTGVDAVAALERANLVRTTDDGMGSTRISMLETIRAVAAELLEASGEAEAIRRRHTEYFLEFAESLQPVRDERLGLLEMEHANLRAALQFAASLPDGEIQLRLCTAMWRIWYVRGLLNEGAAHLQEALRRNTAERSGTRADALKAAAVLAWAQADYQASAAYALDSLELHRRLGDEVGMTRALISLGLAVQARGQLAEARAHHEESRRLADALGLPIELGAALANLGDLARLEGDLQGAQALYRESLAVCRRADDIEGAAIALLYLGIAGLLRGDDPHVAIHLAESLELFTMLRFKERMGACLIGLAADIAHDDAERAGRLFGAGQALREGTTGAGDDWEGVISATTVDTVIEKLGASRSAAAFEHGRARPHETAQEFLEFRRPPSAFVTER